MLEPSLARSLFLTITSFLLGSLMADVVGETFLLRIRGAKTSYRPSDVFFVRMLVGIFCAHSFCWEDSLGGIGLVSFGCIMSLDSPSSV